MVAPIPAGYHSVMPYLTFARALAAGASERRAAATQFYGDRNGTLADPFGHVWTIGTHVEDVSMEEVQRRMTAMAKQAG
jgi:PhnB protein